LLGLKGTMLHVLRARLQGGILNKAGRGELIGAAGDLTFPSAAELTSWVGTYPGKEESGEENEIAGLVARVSNSRCEAVS
jgi:hypothetical protein